jgi:hypothetical protein
VKKKRGGLEEKYSSPKPKQGIGPFRGITFGLGPVFSQKKVKQPNLINHSFSIVFNCMNSPNNVPISITSKHMNGFTLLLEGYSAFNKQKEKHKYSDYLIWNFLFALLKFYFCTPKHYRVL